MRVRGRRGGRERREREEGGRGGRERREGGARQRLVLYS